MDAAAITVMMELFHPGDHLIVDADLYGGSIRLFHNVSEKNGITDSTLRLSVGIEDVKDLLDELDKVFREIEGELHTERFNIGNSYHM